MEVETVRVVGRRELFRIGKSRFMRVIETISLEEHTTFEWAGGAERDRTVDLVIANDALFQLSYGPNSRNDRDTDASGRHKDIPSHFPDWGVIQESRDLTK